ncbi:hypothetical protein P3342_010727 [Pyrenophora teres f. teres]|nr:hypothetical protein P3342_010727 [Pyrenophora teres f. teres]
MAVTLGHLWAPQVVYAVLLGEAYGHRILPFAPVWTIFTTVNLVYAVCATSWLLYWVFSACCWPILIITCLFQFEAPAALARRTLRKTFLRDLHFINDQIAFFDLPALEIDTEVKGLFVIRGVTLSISTMTLVAHGVEAGIKLSDDIELGIQVDRVTVPLFREITVDDVYANVKGGEWEVTFGDVAYGIPEPDDDDSVVVTNTAILRAATQKGGMSGRPADIVTNLTAGKKPTEAEDAASAFSSVKKVAPDEEQAHTKYKELVDYINSTSAITKAKRQLIEASRARHEASTDEDRDREGRDIREGRRRVKQDAGVRLDIDNMDDFRAAISAGSGKWFTALMQQYFFKHYSSQDAEIRRLEARISAWCADANFAVEFGPMQSEAHFPINTNYSIQTHFKISDVMAYRVLPDAVELKQVVRLGGADAVLSIPMFLFPHHEHIFPTKYSDFELLEMESEINEAEPTPKQVQLKKEVEKLKKDEACMHVSAHAHLPAQFHQDLLNFVAAIVKATKVIESDKDFEEAKVLRDLRRVSTNMSDSEASSLASVNTNNSEVSQATVNGNEDKSFRTFLKKVDTGFKEASNKTMVGMRKAGQNTVHAMANDRWIARLVGKVTRKLEKAQGEVGYSIDFPLPRYYATSPTSAASASTDISRHRQDIAMLSRSALCPARAFAKRFPPGIAAPSSIARTASLSTCVRTRPNGRSLATMIHATRHASTSSTTTGTSSTPATNNNSNTNSPGAQPQLTWNAFFALRRTRRRIGQACSGVGAVGVTYFGLTTMINNGYDATLSAQLGGFDPLMLMGLSTLGMMAVGWLIGPVFGNMVFNLAYRGVVGEFTRKDSAFFNRIKQHRVDPTASSLANPPPDYYGEKIGSVAGYRRWLKDQRAFNLKTGRYKATKASESKAL